MPREDNILTRFFTITVKNQKLIEIDCEDTYCVVAKVYQGYWYVFFYTTHNMGIFHESDKFKVIRYIDIDI